MGVSKISYSKCPLALSVGARLINHGGDLDYFTGLALDGVSGNDVGRWNDPCAG